MSIEFWVQIIVYAAGVASLAGGLIARIKTLEKKMDRHNGFMERLAICETKITDVSDNIREIKNELCIIREKLPARKVKSVKEM